ncbi:expressed unknown protein [Seminavis robusta]|uniref:Uncharacterized protein n=1 Tax=Seminavis robusta TaxID=568900 RepID=A0A9N8EFJ9_9STRA|nr:expressed unknown protein [Seminavis robusta]|eukprot:Sro864_g212580.1 n/a (273) ;mRNA; f:6337-7155
MNDDEVDSVEATQSEDQSTAVGTSANEIPSTSQDQHTSTGTTSSPRASKPKTEDTDPELADRKMTPEEKTRAEEILRLTGNSTAIDFGDRKPVAKVTPRTQANIDEKKANFSPSENNDDSTYPPLATLAAQFDESQRSGQLSFFPKESKKQESQAESLAVAQAATINILAVDQEPPKDATAPIDEITQHQLQSQPGAYLQSPGSSLQRTQNLNYDLLSAPVDATPPALLVQHDLRSTGANGHIQNSILLAANANNPLVQANPVLGDPQDATD